MAWTYWKKVDKEKTELEGPYECPKCGGHIMIDGTYLDQVYQSIYIPCPYCSNKNKAPKA